MKRTKFVSIGMLILDDIQFPSGATVRDVVGGSGGYSTFGARVATKAVDSQDIAYVLLAGDDFPDAILENLREWNINLVVKPQSGSKSSRGLLIYEDENFGRKSFRYTTTPLQPYAKDLAGLDALHSTAFHLLARPADLHNHLTDILALRRQYGTESKPLIVWEPFPPECNTSTRDAYLATCKLVDVFSPNHLELAKLFEGDDSSTSSVFDRGIIESYAQKFLDASISPSSPNGAMIVVRSGEHGCLTLSKDTRPRWFPPFYAADSPQVIDTTGAGNTFLGAFAVALQTTDDFHEAAMHASVAASFAVQQIGLPPKSSLNGEDLWNGVSFAQRLEEYRSRVHAD